MATRPKKNSNAGIIAGAVLGLALAYAFNHKSGIKPEIDTEDRASIITDELLDRIEFNESSNDPFAVNPKTDVKGAYQFKEDRWLEVLYKYGAAEGYSKLAARVDRNNIRNKDGEIVQIKYFVRDPKDNDLVLNARFDRDASRAMTRAGLENDFWSLKAAMGGRTVEKSDTTFYLMHHFGTQGAVKILTAVQTTPNKLFNSIVRYDVCAKNKEICFNGSRARTALEVHALLGNRLENTPASALSYNR